MFRKYKQLFFGVVIGAVIVGIPTAFADQNISAAIQSVNYVFNGAPKPLGNDYVSINYNGHVYVPARFVAESLGASVGYNGNTQTITITSGSSGANGTQSSGVIQFSNTKSQQDSFGYTNVIGIAKNTDSVTHSFTIVVSFFDASGNLLGTASGAMNDLAAGDSKTFTCIATADYSKAASYKVQVDTLVQ